MYIYIYIHIYVCIYIYIYIYINAFRFQVSDEEAEEAKEKFLAIQTAYELLCEGMENGGEGMKGAVFSGGDLEFNGSGQFAEGAAASASVAAALSAGGGYGGGGVGGGVSGTGGGGSVGGGDGRGGEAAASVSAAPVTAALAAAAAAASISIAAWSEGLGVNPSPPGTHAADKPVKSDGVSVNSDGVSVKSGGVSVNSDGVSVNSDGVSVNSDGLLRRDEVELLLSCKKIQTALAELAARPEAVRELRGDLPLMGLLLTLAARGTRGIIFTSSSTNNHQWLIAYVTLSLSSSFVGLWSRDRGSAPRLKA